MRPGRGCPAAGDCGPFQSRGPVLSSFTFSLTANAPYGAKDTCMTNLSFHRGRRLRRTPALRDMVRETALSANDLIMPYFVVDTPDENFRQPIASMPGQYQLSLAELEKEIGKAVETGLRSVLLFGIPAEKDPVGSGAYARDGIVQRATRMIKKNWPDLVVVTDLCLCEYTSHGHCGIIADGDKTGHVLNDPTLDLLARTAVSQAEAGADVLVAGSAVYGAENPAQAIDDIRTKAEAAFKA